MNILVVSSYLPYPLFSGGHIRLYNLLNELSKNHKITLVCEKRSYQTEKDIFELEKICSKVITVNRKKQWTLTNILKAGFSPYPFLLVGHTNPSMRRIIQNLLEREKFDLIHVETFYIMQNLPKTNLPIVLAEHNIEYLVYKRFADQLKPVLKQILLLDITKIKYWEKRCWEKVSKLIAVSDDEKKLMIRSDVEVVPNGVDVKKFEPRFDKNKTSEKQKTILFIGDFRWIQNRDAVNWILKELWPKLNLKLKNKGLDLNLKLWIVGKNIPDDIKKLTNDENVIFDQNAPEQTQQIFSQATLLLAPIRVGGGTSFKILEAMASGVPVVTTKLGIEGIDASENEDVLISNQEEGLIKHIINLLEDKTLYNKLAKNARKLIEDKYDWKIISKKLESVYLSVIQK